MLRARSSHRAWGLALALAGCSVSPPVLDEVVSFTPPRTAASVGSSAPAPSAAASPATPPRAPAPTLPAGDTVTLDDLVAALAAIALAMEAEPTVRADFDALRESFALPDDPALYRDYVRVKLVFESARDGGLWQIQWRITNREPRSDAIWTQWQGLTDAPGDDATASAECDELSALFAFLVRRLGVENVGLFWPVWNHVVAVWTVADRDGAPVRIVVPTSQIFLDDAQSLGTRGFDPGKQKTIYEYRRRDAKPTLALPAALARFLVERSWADAHRPQAELQRERNERSARIGGS
ncbi:MAG TPA: hypothetical protein VFG69_17390 [Nannocystaceae bacterium]|nr:hypothetical protein [Nannocystaceae bacterium]